jgi:hypothetical protein
MGLFRVGSGIVSCLSLVHNVHHTYPTSMSETVIREVGTLLALNIPWCCGELMIDFELLKVTNGVWIFSR